MEVSTTLSFMRATFEIDFYVLLIRYGTIVLSLNGLSPSTVPIDQYFVLEKGYPIYSKCRIIAPRHNQVVPE